MKRIVLVLSCLLGVTVASAAPVRIADTPEALAGAMQGHRMVILGEVHDNGIQHALRAAALRKLVEGGARLAIAFEQFDRGMQGAIDAARKERPRDADYRAQIARDRALAESIAPYASGGVVLLTGNGHARTDIGVAHWLPAQARASSRSIALLGSGGGTTEPPTHFDAYVLTTAVERPDPCKALGARMKPKG